MANRTADLILNTLLSVVFVQAVMLGSQAAAETPAGEAEPSDALRPSRRLEGITEYNLGNGLKVLLCPDPYKPTITVSMTYRFGSRHEGPGEAGMAHMLEHLLIGGTRDFPSLLQTLDRVGAEYNGSTWFDRVNFYETLMAGEENLDLALHIEAERMLNASFGDEELTREKGVIANEFEMDENDPLEILSQRMLSAAYLWHAYGRTPMGNLSEIRSYSLESVRSFYERLCRPDNATLIIAGRFDSERALRLVQKHFAKISVAGRRPVRSGTVEPPQDGPRSVTLLRAGGITAAGLAYHVPAGSHPDAPAVLLLREILAAEHASRLDRALVKAGLAARVAGNDNALTLAEPGLMQITAEAGAGQEAEVLVEAMAETVEAVGREGVTEEELERARARQLRKFRQITADTSRLAVELSEWVALGDWRLFFAFRDGLKRVTKADVDRVARTYLVASNRTAGLFISQADPARAVVPTAPALAGALAGYGASSREELSVPLPTPQTDWADRVVHMRLPPGLIVASLQKPTRSGTVHLQLRLRYGNAGTLRGRKPAATLLPRLMARGTRRYDYEELLHRFDLLQSEISIAGHAGVISVSIESDSEHLVAAVELAGEMLRKPAFDPAQFDLLVKERRTQLEASLSSPVERCFNAIRRGLYTWPPTSIHYMPTLEEQVEELESTSVEDVRKLYSELVGGSHVAVAIVGDFDTGKTLQTLARAFEGWESPQPYSPVLVPHKPIEPLERRIRTRDKRMAIVGMATLMNLRDDDPDFPALEIANHILGGSPSARLQQRLRHRDGLTYHTASLAEVGDRDRSSAFFVYAFCSPVNVPAVHAAMREEIRRWIGKGITDAELAEAKTSYLRERALEIADDREIARQIVRYAEIDRSLSFRSTLLENVEALSTAEVNVALGRLLSDAPFVEIEAGDLE